MSDAKRPLIGLIWILVAAVLLVGGYKLLHLDGRSDDQKILIEKSK